MTTTKKSTKKSTPAVKPTLSAKAKKAISDFKKAEEEGENEDGGKIAQILALFVSGVPQKEIVDLGFNRTTVYRQTGELKKLQKAPALEYYGFDLFERRLQNVMKAKKLSREDAFNLVSEADIAAAKETPVEAPVAKKAAKKSTTKKA